MPGDGYSRAFWDVCWLTDELSATLSTRIWKSFSISMPFLWGQTERKTALSARVCLGLTASAGFRRSVWPLQSFGDAIFIFKHYIGIDALLLWVNFAPAKWKEALWYKWKGVNWNHTISLLVEPSESLGLKNKQLLETHLIAATLRDMEGSSLTCWNETQCYWRWEVAATWRLSLFFRGVFTTERKRIDSMDPLSLKRLRRVWEGTKKVASLWTSTLLLSYKYCNYCTTSNLHVSWKILERATVQLCFHSVT